MSAVGFDSMKSYALSPSDFNDNNVDSHEMLSLVVPSNPNSCTSSSLAPSDSASQCTPSNTDQAAVQHFLKLVEAPSKQPPCVHPSILWYSNNCTTDKTAGDIVIEANKYQPKTHLILCHEDGSILSSAEYDNIQMSVNLFATRLIELARANHQLCPPGSKLPTKTNIKKWFKHEYTQFLLELEAEQKYLHLCVAHWKADNFIGQAFQQQSDAEHKCRIHEASSMPSSQKQCNPAPTPNIPVSSMVTTNMAKHAFELGPGPKSPSALQAQKCSKDKSKSSGQKNKDPLAMPSNHMYSLCWSSNH